MFPSTQHWQPALEGDGFVEGLADIQQCISNILSTPLGAEPMRPDFGSNLHLYIDWPIDRARPHIVREAVDAIRRWEKRITVTRVTVEAVDVARIALTVFFKLSDGIERSLEVRP